ncbi:MAG: hypothetical protein HWN81_04635 [Candidatus Lokiarchaeota archaeon]|nr:hypothetical protein [Candidatus Lokiarchaeota archaeon]
MSDEKIFECNLNDTNLFNCILNEVGEKDLSLLSDSAPSLSNKTYINCINASLVNCLKNNKEELEYPQVQLQIIKDESEEWLINQINIIVNTQFDDNLIIERINQCLKFVKKACKIDESIQLSIIHSEIKENLKYYKLKLNEVNQLLQEVKNDKSKKVELFSLFKNIANNK